MHVLHYISLLMHFCRFYYNNLKLGGTITQYYIIGVIDIDNNVIWYYETERLIDYKQM